MKFLFIAGSGRSGASAMTVAISQSSKAFFTFHDVELKLFNESGGLGDLYHAFVENFCFSRVRERIREFEIKYKRWLYTGVEWGQPPVAPLVDRVKYELAFESYIGKLKDPIERRLSEDEFLKVTRDFVFELVGSMVGESGSIFVEKTPHIILDYKFLKRLFPDSIFLVVLRDPRATAISSAKFEWAGGLGDLPRNIAWVKSFYDAYFEVRKFFGSDVLEVKIEDGQSALDEFIDWISMHENSELNFVKSDFAFAPQNYWLNDVTSADDKILLSNELDLVAAKLGYSK